MKFPNRGMLLQILLVAMLVKLLLLVISYQRTVKICRFLSHANLRYQLTFLELQELSYRIAATFAIFNHCLVWSLALFTVFKITFPELAIKIGVNQEAGFQAHAWIENQGQIIDLSQSNFQEIYCEN